MFSIKTKKEEIQGCRKPVLSERMGRYALVNFSELHSEGELFMEREPKLSEVTHYFFKDFLG